MTTCDLNPLLARAAEKLRRAKRVVVLTGAGVSAESGIPTFRDAQTGLWEKYDPAELASPEGFRADPKLVWDWYEYRRELVRNRKPNAAHYALAELEVVREYEQFTLVTQNVDQYHTLAGSQNVLELHGRILENRCFEEGRLLSTEELDYRSVPPRCPCGSFARPGVVWFGEQLPAAVLIEAFAVAKRAEVCLVVGTSGLVQPAASIPERAQQYGAFVIEVNPQPSAVTRMADLFLCGAAGEILPEIVERLRNEAKDVDG